MGKLKRLSDDDVQDIVKDALSSATSFVESEISQDRIKSQRYFVETILERPSSSPMSVSPSK